jgi:hypothetical protein
MRRLLTLSQRLLKTDIVAAVRDVLLISLTAFVLVDVPVVFHKSADILQTSREISCAS